MISYFEHTSKQVPDATRSNQTELELLRLDQQQFPCHFNNCVIIWNLEMVHATNLTAFLLKLRKCIFLLSTTCLNWCTAIIGVVGQLQKLFLKLIATADVCIGCAMGPC